MYKIGSVSSLEILDSRGNWTVETTIELNGKFLGSASVPSGASVGSHEMKAVPAKTAVSGINGLLAERLKGTEYNSQSEFDQFILSVDSAPDRGSLGANTLLSLSLAFCKACAQKEGLPLYRYLSQIYGQKKELVLPQPIFNIVNGGKHAQNRLDFQEFIIIPRGQGTFDSSLSAAVNIFHTLGSLLETGGFSTNLGDEGGYAPGDLSHEAVLDFILDAAKKSGFKPGDDVFLGIDAAASTLALGDIYSFKRADLQLNVPQLLGYYEDLASRFPLIYLEDPFSEDDFLNFQLLNSQLGGRVEVVGDDLTVTNIERVREAVEKKAVSAVIVKPNQIGTLTESLEVIKFAQSKSIGVVISHRSGETDDPFIADLAVGVGSKYIKAGAPARGERVAKYDRLLEIESEMNR
ncbi:MAG: enolase [Patescibacteria group bacterium]|nr:enolase [Patescibacteria group bacterium]